MAVPSLSDTNCRFIKSKRVMWSPLHAANVLHVLLELCLALGWRLMTRCYFLYLMVRVCSGLAVLYVFYPLMLILKIKH